jgi:uncharacterized protein
MTKRDTKMNLDDLLSKAESGDIQALYELGCYYFYLPKAESDYKKAVKYWKMGAKKGDACAMYALGRFYDGGVGIPKTYKKAELVARKGPDDFHYGSRNGLKCIINKSMEWFKAAAKLGHIGAMIYYSKYFVDNPESALEEDRHNTFVWLGNAAFDCNNKLALYKLSEMMMYGIGYDYCADNRAEGFRMLKESAEMGCSEAQLTLAHIFSAQANKKQKKLFNGTKKLTKKTRKMLCMRLQKVIFTVKA